jgi:hypothetical protein
MDEFDLDLVGTLSPGGQDSSGAIMQEVPADELGLTAVQPSMINYDNAFTAWNATSTRRLDAQVTHTCQIHPVLPLMSQNRWGLDSTLPRGC